MCSQKSIEGESREGWTAISSWYDKYASISFKTRILVLPENFVEYLLSDGPMMLPRTKRNKTKEELAWFFPELEEELERAIDKVGGKAFIKLNWTAPRDSAWIIGSLQCTSADDVFALLKASELILPDLNTKEKKVIAVREWRDLEPSMEFRCFVKHHCLIAACQRRYDTTYNYEHSELESIRNRLAQFFDAHLRGKYENLVFDVYLDTKGRHRDWLVGINALAPSTNALLFDWNELLPYERQSTTSPEAPTLASDIELRVAVTPNSSDEKSPYPVIGSNEFASSRVPTDTLHLFQKGGIDALMDLVQKSNQDDITYDSEEDEKSSGTAGSCDDRSSIENDAFSSDDKDR